MENLENVKALNDEDLEKVDGGMEYGNPTNDDDYPSSSTKIESDIFEVKFAPAKEVK